MNTVKEAALILQQKIDGDVENQAKATVELDGKESLVGVYCRVRGRVAILDGQGRCSGNFMTKGEGMEKVEDEYGVDYVKPCEKALGGKRLIVRVRGEVAIEGCLPEVDVSRLGVGGPDRAMFASEPE